MQKGKASTIKTLQEDKPHETTSQPWIAGANIGSLSTNWRKMLHAKPPPPPSTNVLDMALLIAELKAQCKDDHACQENDNAHNRRKLDLDKKTPVATIVVAVFKRFSKDNILKPNGSNLRQWERMLCLHASKRFGNPDYFTPNEDSIPDPATDRIAHGIINSLVHSNLTYDLLDLDYAWEVFSHLIAKFQVVNQAAQLQSWINFIIIDPTKHNMATSLSEAFLGKAKTFSEQGIYLTWDEMMGLIIQKNLRDQLRQLVDQKINLYMEAHNYQVPTGQDVLRFVDVACTKQHLAKSSRLSKTKLLCISLASQPGPEAPSSQQVNDV
ncbi:hypothetical protein PCASD_06430 [Puccinia coronata f. sp. avenae]|uniref:Uncharacterized protein n=1 Tax=Puccinia coronata f. sp. avenae TaxID=200324 RepID=A0A2N5UFL3_9BASI|nr:hypothetical protein PCASD_06430 [Puccinia coronata f. sp. avenae]